MRPAVCICPPRVCRAPVRLRGCRACIPRAGRSGAFRVGSSANIVPTPHRSVAHLRSYAVVRCCVTVMDYAAGSTPRRPGGGVPPPSVQCTAVTVPCMCARARVRASSILPAPRGGARWGGRAARRALSGASRARGVGAKVPHRRARHLVYARVRARAQGRLPRGCRITAFEAWSKQKKCPCGDRDTFSHRPVSQSNLRKAIYRPYTP